MDINSSTCAVTYFMYPSGDLISTQTLIITTQQITDRAGWLNIQLSNNELDVITKSLLLKIKCNSICHNFSTRMLS